MEISKHQWIVLGCIVMLINLNLNFIMGSLFIFKKVTCESLDKNFGSTTYCYIKPIKRNLYHLKLKYHIKNLPLTNLTMRLQLMYRTVGGGWKPWLYDTTIDVCRPDKLRSNPVMKIFFNFFQNFSNLNHSCPFEHDLIVDPVPNTIVGQELGSLVFPPGSYACFTTWMYFNVPKVKVNIYADTTTL